MPNDPIRYTAGPGTGRSATEILVRLRRDAVPRECHGGFADLPEGFKHLVERFPPHPDSQADPPQLRTMSICPVFLEANSLLPTSAPGFLGRLIKGVIEYLGPARQLLRLGGAAATAPRSEGDLLNLLTNFRLRFSDAADARAAFQLLQAEPSVMKAEWSPLRVIAVTVQRGETRFHLDGDPAPAAARRARSEDFGDDGSILGQLAQIRDLLADLKSCACQQKTAVPGVPDASYTNWGRTAIERPDDPDLGKDVTVAMLDLGVDHTHPELAGRIIHGLSIPVDASDEQMKDGTMLGAEFALHPFRPRGYHGTAVAGIMAGERLGVLPKARVVSFQVASAAPLRSVDGWGREVLFYPVDQVLYNSSLMTLASLRMPAQGGVNIPEVTVLNMSIGGEAPLCQAEQIALGEVAAKGILMVAAAGNHTKPGDFSGVMYPARNPMVLSVGAVGVDGSTLYYKHANFSNFDADDFLVNIVAPGSGIYQCVPLFVRQTGYGWGDGTSFASPHVSAIAAHAIHKLGTYEPKDHSVRLKDQKPGVDFDERHGWGLAKWPTPSA